MPHARDRALSPRLNHGTAMKRVTIWGTSFAKIGDEAQIAAAAIILRRLCPDADVAVLDRHHAKTDKLYPNIERIRLRNIFRSVPRILRSDLLVVVGAPFFETPRQALACVIVFTLASIAHVPTVAYGITVFQPKSWWGPPFLRLLFRIFQLVAVRERVGVEILRSLGITDNVALIDDTRSILQPTDKASVSKMLEMSGIDPDHALIGITTRYIHDDVPEWVKRDHGVTPERVSRANEAIGRMVSELSDYGQILVIPMHPAFAEDEAMAAMLRKHVSDPERVHLLSTACSAQDCIGIIDHCDLVLSCRLASTIFALNVGTPTFAIAYESRVSNLMQEAGCSDCVLSWDQLDVDQALAQLRIFIEEQKQLRHKFGQIAEARRSRAWKNIELLADYLR